MPGSSHPPPSCQLAGTEELDYTEQSSWLLFLKYLDALEAELDGKTYSFIIDKPYRWESWAAPKGPDGKLDHNIALTGDDLRDVIELVDELRFRPQTEKHELSHLYEAKIKNMGNAGRNSGEYYTPRPLIRAMIQMVAPRIGERIYDGACGSAGFQPAQRRRPSPVHRGAKDLCQQRAELVAMTDQASVLLGRPLLVSMATESGRFRKVRNCFP